MTIPRVSYYFSLNSSAELSLAARILSRTLGQSCLLKPSFTLMALRMVIAQKSLDTLTELRIQRVKNSHLDWIKITR